MNRLILMLTALAVAVMGTHASAWPNPTNIGCEDSQPFLPLSDFEAGSQNSLGGNFFTVSDFDSLGNSTNPAKGGSVATDSIYKDGYMVMSAKLNKRDGATYHKDAGWADITTTFKGGDAVDLKGITGIGFMLVTMGINAERIQNITFKVKMMGVSDTAVHQVDLPVAQIVAADSAGKVVCIRPQDLAQPARVSQEQRVAFDPSRIQQLFWEAKIADSGSPEIDTATANLLLANVIFYGGGDIGPDEPIGAVPVVGRTKPFVSYSNRSLRLNGFAGATRFEIRDLGGKVVAAFGAASQVPIALSRGTYLLSSFGDGAPTTTKFSVFDR